MIHTVKHLCYTIKIRETLLTFLLNKVDNFYYESKSDKMKYGKPQPGPDGKPKTRTLHPSTDLLKDVQKRINQNILSQLPIPPYAFGSVQGRNNIENAKQHLGNKFFFCADLKSFFPSITNKMVFQAFRSYDFSPTVARILTRLTTYKGCLPQGAPTSPNVANIVFVSTGLKILKLIDGKEITFSTFLDDFSFSSKSNFKDLVMPILEILKADGYWLNHKKISYKTKDPEVTGVIIRNGKLIPHIKVLERQAEINSLQLGLYIDRVMSS